MCTSAARQRHSAALSGTQRHSAALSGTQRHSVARSHPQLFHEQMQMQRQHGGLFVSFQANVQNLQAQLRHLGRDLSLARFLHEYLGAELDHHHLTCEFETAIETALRMSEAPIGTRRHSEALRGISHSVAHPSAALLEEDIMDA